ncbi:MAG: N-substituted formamide deformylase precursor [Candidatus Heimdallarchaeota archaeon LC_2]|nr:MAG: N-substituted formamide deformylase precursor [Candidatus Heimdallarchaeota archaeon LC_2]
MKKAFVGAKIHTMEGEPIENAILIIDGSSIVEVGENLSTDGYEVIDCKGMEITPGLIDAHSHVGLWEEGVSPGPAVGDGNETSEAIVPYLRSMDSIFPEDLGFDDARKGGVTTMGLTHGSANPIGGQFCVVKSRGHVIDEMVIREPAGVKMAMGENPKRVGVNNKRAPHTRMAVAYLIRKSFYETLDYAQKWEGYYKKIKSIEEGDDENKKKNDLPSKPEYDLGKEILLKVLNREIPIRCHSHRADDIRTAIRLSEEFGYKLVIDHATESSKIKEIIAEKNLPCVIGPLFGTRVKRELVNKSLKTPGIMVKAGVMVCITTDAPVIPIDGLRDTVVMAIREGLPADRALETITLNPAKVLNVDDRVGSLKAGKDADFVIFDGDPFDVRNRVLKTYIDGDLVYEYSEDEN